MSRILLVILMKKYKYIILNITISLGLGILSTLLTMNSMDLYKKINIPKIAIPTTIFSLIWIILYILIGFASYLIHREKNNNKESALILYYFLLILNFSWPIVFFNYQNFLLALAILLALNISTIFLIYLFYKIKHISTYLLLPYFIWNIYILYLNFWIFLHN